MEWRKSSYSDGTGGNCLETVSANGLVMVRDTANRDAGTLAFTAQAWQAFTDSMR
jgi:hypothetical protein